MNKFECSLSLILSACGIFCAGIGLSISQIAGCRDCTIGECLAVPRAEGGCPACICHGVLLPDCPPTNCSTSCRLVPLEDGCYDCACPKRNSVPVVSEVEELASSAVCPPVPPCPSRCQIQLASGCPRCTCPDQVRVQCPVVICPRRCMEITGADGCPACECPPEDIICPALPACALGCVDESDDPELRGCLGCNCTLAADLLLENQVLADGDIRADVELMTDPVDAGLAVEVGLTHNDEVVVDTLRPTTIQREEGEQIIPVERDSVLVDPLPDTVHESLPVSVDTDDNVLVQIDPFVNDENILVPFDGESTRVPLDLTTVNDTPVGQTNTSFVGKQPSNTQTTENMRTGANRPAVPPPKSTTRPKLNIPCGEISCPDGCSLCIQTDGCGRCLCGEYATICPAVPACQAACITQSPNGCFTCACPQPNLILQRFPPQQFVPHPHAGRPVVIGLGSEEVLFPARVPFLPETSPGVRVIATGGFPNVNRITEVQGSVQTRRMQNSRPGSRSSAVPRRENFLSPGSIAIQNIPRELLGVSRFQLFP